MDTTTRTVTDSLGVEIRVGDRVRVLAWGAPIRLVDCGSTATVMGINRNGNVQHDTDLANGSAMSPGCLGVLRRDGGSGYEGNRACDTCGDPIGRPTGAGNRASCAGSHGA